MDTMKIGGYIQHLRKAAGLTQKELAEKLGVSFQAVSKWENGDALPDTGLLLELCDELNTTADKLLNGGSVLLKNRKLMRVEDVIIGFENMEDVGRYFGENCDFFTGMVKGINQKMNIDLWCKSIHCLRSRLRVLKQNQESYKTVSAKTPARSKLSNRMMLSSLVPKLKKFTLPYHTVLLSSTVNF